MNKQILAPCKVTTLYNVFQKNVTSQDQPFFFPQHIKSTHLILREIKMGLLQSTNAGVRIVSLSVELGQGQRQAYSPSVYSVHAARENFRNTRDSLGRHLLHSNTGSETQLQQPQLSFSSLHRELCEVISHSCHWLLWLPTFCQTPTSASSGPLIKLGGNTTHCYHLSCHAQSVKTLQKTSLLSEEGRSFT